MNIDPMDSAEQTLFDSLPLVPVNGGFIVMRVDIYTEPHAYLWTRQHVTYAINNSTTLQVAATTGNIACGRACGITFANHKKLVVLVIGKQRGADIGATAQGVLFDYLRAVVAAVGVNTFSGFEFVPQIAPLVVPAQPINVQPLGPITIPK